MCKKLHLFQVFIFCLVLLCGKTVLGEGENAAPEEQPNSPRIKVADDVFDFGTAEQHQKIPHVFHFSNIGGSPLQIQKVRSSCGCTAALASAKVIPPGGDGEVRVTFSTGTMSGNKTKSVFLHSNDPVQPVTTFKIKGKIRAGTGTGKSARIERPRKVWAGAFKRGAVPAADRSSSPKETSPGPRDLIQIQPRTCVFGSVSVGEPAVKRVTLNKPGKKGFDLTGVRSTLPFISAEYRKDKANEYTITVKLSREAPEGRFLGSVVFYTDDPLQPSLIMRTFGTITAAGENKKAAVPSK